MNPTLAVCLAVAALVALVAIVALARALLAARIGLAAAEARLTGRDELAESRSRELAAQRESLKAEFAKLAADLLGDKQSALAKANEASVSSLFANLGERLENYRREVAESSRKSAEMGAEMKANVASLQKFADAARSFTAALVGGNKIQGNKGEEILASILEQSGLRRGVHYDVQQGDGDEGRPDVSIYDVRNRHVILLDSKMNIKDYIAAYNLPDDAAHREEKARALKAHVASIRRQVDGLAAKNYAARVTPKDGYDNLPLVAMFCPFDTVLEAALVEDPTLVQYAYEKNIVFVTPLTLWGYLWLVSWGWRQHEVERRYDEIQHLGRDVITAVDAMLDDLESMGASLEKSRAAYDSLYRRATLDKGQMSVRRVATKLLAYGVAPKGRLKQLGREQPSGDGG